MQFLFRLRQLWAVAALLCLFLLPGVASAKPKEAQREPQTINFFQVHTETEDGQECQQLEIGLSSGPVVYYVKESKKPNQLVIVLPNTVPGDILKKIPLYGRYAKELSVRKRKKTTELTLTLMKPAEESYYRIRTVAPDRKAGKPHRLVIDLTKEAPAADENSVAGLKGRTIVIDPGHGGTDSGAHGPVGSLEKDITLKVAQRVKNILHNSGANVLMTREDDVDVWGPTATDYQELQARVDVGIYNPKTEVFLSIHCNAYDDPAANGTETFYYHKSWLDELLAKNLQARLIEQGGLRNRGIDTARFYVCRHSVVPAALVELAFISNYREELLLSNEDFQQKMALGICEGLANYFAVLPKDTKEQASGGRRKR